MLKLISVHYKSILFLQQFIACRDNQIDRLSCRPEYTLGSSRILGVVLLDEIILKIAAIQTRVLSDVTAHFKNVKSLVLEAASNEARLIVTQEALLSGYPPIEFDDPNSIDFNLQQDFVSELIETASEKGVYLALGLIRKEGQSLKNSLMLITPKKTVSFYDKRALWGWDADNFSPGNSSDGIIVIDGIKVGFRLCFEVRFPEYFRELYVAGVDVAVVSFCDLAKEPDSERYELIKSHLRTRAVENSYTVVSVNSVTLNQTAPTCFISPEGRIRNESPLNEEAILYYDYYKKQPSFGQLGRIHYADKLTSKLRAVDAKITPEMP